MSFIDKNIQSMMSGFKNRYANLHNMYYPSRFINPSIEHWDKWDKLESMSKSVWDAETAAFASRKKDPAGAASARGVQMRYYDAQVKWMLKFGFKGFEDVRKARNKMCVKDK